MAKALMVGSVRTTLASGDEFNLFGGPIDAIVTELNAQASATEACTFSKLGANIISGGSLVNNFQFRKAGANGNQLATRSGVGVAEDATNTDVLAAADLFNIAYTDTGTNSVISWARGNVEFTSGYGAFVGSANHKASIFDVGNATRFIPLSGNLPVDGAATEANVAFKARGYTTFDALQVRVITNPRTTASTFKNRIDGVDGTGSCSFAAAATGLVTSTGLGNAIADGNTIGASITLLAGLEDLIVSFVAATLKSTDTEQDTWCAFADGIDRAASATAHYFTIGGQLTALTALTEAQARIKPGYAGTAKNLRCYLSANTYTVDGTLKLFKNGVAVLTATITQAGGAGWYENITDSVTFTDTDELSFEIVGGTSLSITIHMIGITLKPDVPSTANASFLLLMV